MVWVQTILFDDKVAPQRSYLNDVRFSRDDRGAYLTYSGAKGATRRVASSMKIPSIQADPNIIVDVTPRHRVQFVHSGPVPVNLTQRGGQATQSEDEHTTGHHRLVPQAAGDEGDSSSVRAKRPLT